MLESVLMSGARKLRKRKGEADEAMQTFATVCAYCRNFDAVSTGFFASNRAKCRADGREHWKGDFATDCPHFVDRRDV